MNMLIELVADSEKHMAIQSKYRLINQLPKSLDLQNEKNIHTINDAENKKSAPDLLNHLIDQNKQKKYEFIKNESLDSVVSSSSAKKSSIIDFLVRN